MTEPGWVAPPALRGPRIAAIVTAVVAVLLVIGGGVALARLSGDKETRATAPTAIPSDNCGDVITRDARGTALHVAPGTPIRYAQSPPANGKHWGNFLQGVEIRTFYTAADRPPVERLVHSLEHGYTIVWYDAQVDDDAARAIADDYSVEDKVLVAPWSEADGPAFPAGHVALTHWTGPRAPHGVWEYCRQPDPDAVATFVLDYPMGNAPEPGAY
jgi:hypothetical protein